MEGPIEKVILLSRVRGMSEAAYCLTCCQVRELEDTPAMRQLVDVMTTIKTNFLAQLYELGDRVAALRPGQEGYGDAVRQVRKELDVLVGVMPTT